VALDSKTRKYTPSKSDPACIRMKVLHSIPELAEITSPLVLAIGVFDGLHLGHRAVLERARLEATRIGGIAVPVSFDPHPARVLRPDQAPLQLTAPKHKLRILADLGFERCLLLPFNSALAATAPDSFIRSIATTARPLAAVCVGETWSFGKGRQGNLQLLRTLGSELGFTGIGVPEVELEGEPVSSTRIRSALANGSLDLAAQLLGRPYSVLGEVLHGRAIGRTIGFPTANLTLHQQQLPPHGVYAIRVRLPHTATYSHSSHFSHPGVANLGLRPTITPGETAPTLEAHLFDFSGDLYGQSIEVEFVQFLRLERRFDSLEALRHQIQTDSAFARASLSNSASLSHPATSSKDL
jgi:riboflavin kinase/FMN adenylyltransferase